MTMHPKTLLEVNLRKRLRLLEGIEPVDNKARVVMWHRIDEVRKALDLKPEPMPQDLMDWWGRTE